MLPPNDPYDTKTLSLMHSSIFQFLEFLLQTILYRLQEDLDQKESEEGIMVARRFVRSVIRVYVILVACVGNTVTKRKRFNFFISEKYKIPGYAQLGLFLID